MNGITILLAIAAVGVDYDRQRADDGRPEYRVQLEPELREAAVELATLPGSRAVPVADNASHTVRRGEAMLLAFAGQTVPRPYNTEVIGAANRPEATPGPSAGVGRSRYELPGQSSPSGTGSYPPPRPGGVFVPGAPSAGIPGTGGVFPVQGTGGGSSNGTGTGSASAILGAEPRPQGAGSAGYTAPSAASSARNSNTKDPNSTVPSDSAAPGSRVFGAAATEAGASDGVEPRGTAGGANSAVPSDGSFDGQGRYVGPAGESGAGQGRTQSEAAGASGAGGSRPPANSAGPSSSIFSGNSGSLPGSNGSAADRSLENTRVETAPDRAASGSGIFRNPRDSAAGAGSEPSANLPAGQAAGTGTAPRDFGGNDLRTGPSGTPASSPWAGDDAPAYPALQPPAQSPARYAQPSDAPSGGLTRGAEQQAGQTTGDAGRWQNAPPADAYGAPRQEEIRRAQAGSGVFQPAPVGAPGPQRPATDGSQYTGQPRGQEGSRYSGDRDHVYVPPRVPVPAAGENGNGGRGTSDLWPNSAAGGAGNAGSTTRPVSNDGSNDGSNRATYGGPPGGAETPPGSETSAGRSDVPSPGTSPEAERPWVPLTITMFGLLLSLGANAYLAWIALGLHARYRELVYEMRHSRAPA